MDGSENKKLKGIKKFVIKRKLKFENYKNCLEVTQLENKINHLKKLKLWKKVLKKMIKKFMKNNKLVIKTQQRFKSERHHVFTKEINKIVFISNGDKRMQSTELVETHAYGTKKDLASKKEEIKCNSTIKRYKND